MVDKRTMEERWENYRVNMEEAQDENVKHNTLKRFKKKRKMEERRAVARCSSSATPSLTVIIPSH